MVLGLGVVVVAFVLVVEMDAAAIATTGWVNLQPVCVREEHPTCLTGGCLEQGFGRYSGEGLAACLHEGRASNMSYRRLLGAGVWALQW